MALIDRRALLKALPVGGLVCLLNGSRSVFRRSAAPGTDIELPELDPVTDEGAGLVSLGGHDHLHKIRDFDRDYPDDFRLDEDRLEVLVSTAARLERALAFIGHGHFNLVSFDDLLSYADRYSQIGAFTAQELAFLDEIFHVDASTYGFYGAKVLDRQTAVIAERDVKKIAGTGHFLLRGEPLQKYERIRSDLGDSVYLTSGVRAIAKQYQLFVSKAVETNGNLSQASRSLAPPGYSYHAIGDFDVGRVGFGLKNFSAEFAETPEYRRLIDLGYVGIRYTEVNPFGVRHEPWHIKIA